MTARGRSFLIWTVLFHSYLVLFSLPDSLFSFSDFIHNFFYINNSLFSPLLPCHIYDPSFIVTALSYFVGLLSSSTIVVSWLHPSLCQSKRKQSVSEISANLLTRPPGLFFTMSLQLQRRAHLVQPGPAQVIAAPQVVVSKSIIHGTKSATTQQQSLQMAMVFLHCSARQEQFHCGFRADLRQISELCYARSVQ